MSGVGIWMRSECPGKVLSELLGFIFVGCSPGAITSTERMGNITGFKDFSGNIPKRMVVDREGGQERIKGLGSVGS